MLQNGIFKVELSKPPSANRIWRNVAGRTLKSREYRSWLSDQVAVVWMEWSAHPMISSACEVHILYTPKDRRFMDLDNVAKPVLDLLQKAGVIENDRLVEVLHLRRCPPRTNTDTVLVTVIEL